MMPNEATQQAGLSMVPNEATEPVAGMARRALLSVAL